MGRTAEPDPFEIGIAPGHGRVVDGLAEVQPLLHEIDLADCIQGSIRIDE